MATDYSAIKRRLAERQLLDELGPVLDAAVDQATTTAASSAGSTYLTTATAASTYGTKIVSDALVTKTAKLDATTGRYMDASFVTPVNAVAATQTLTYTHGSQPTAAKIVTVNGKAYTFVAGPVAAEGDVLIGADEDATLTNLHRAINRSGGTPDTDYKVAAAHTTVSSSINTTSHVLTFTAKTAGVAGNAYTLTTDETTFTAGGAVFASGVDGTLGAKGEIYVDASYIYLCTAANTISGANWKRAGLSTY